MFEKVMQEIVNNHNKSFCCVLAIDTPGFGGSSHVEVEATMPSYATAIAEAIRCYLSGQPKTQCFVYGHHTGAAVALQLAVDASDLVKGLLLHGPPLLTTPEMRDKVRNMYATPPLAADGAHFTAIWDRIRAKDPGLPLALSHREALLSLQAGGNYVAGYGAVADQDAEALLARVVAPVLILAGGRDSLKGCVEPTIERLRPHTSVHHTALPEDAGTYACDTHPAEANPNPNPDPDPDPDPNPNWILTP